MARAGYNLSNGGNNIFYRLAMAIPKWVPNRLHCPLFIKHIISSIFHIILTHLAALLQQPHSEYTMRIEVNLQQATFRSVDAVPMFGYEKKKQKKHVHRAPNFFWIFTSILLGLGFWDHLVHCPYCWPIHRFFGFVWRISLGIIASELAGRQRGYIPSSKFRNLACQFCYTMGWKGLRFPD